MLTPISGHLANLEDFNFCFCKAVFHKIHSLTDVLFSYLQKLSFNILSSWIKIDAILQKIQELRNDFDAFLKLQNVTLKHPDRAEEVLFLHVMLGPIFAFFLMK